MSLLAKFDTECTLCVVKVGPNHTSPKRAAFPFARSNVSFKEAYMIFSVARVVATRVKFVKQKAAVLLSNTSCIQTRFCTNMPPTLRNNARYESAR